MRPIRLFALLFALLAISAVPAAAQSQAINGTIEGTVKDAQGGLLPGVTVTITNTDTGTTRVVVTNGQGLYRAPLLQLGAHKISAELSGFGKFEQTGLQLAAGQTLVLNMTLKVGGVTAVIPSMVYMSRKSILVTVQPSATVTVSSAKPLPIAADSTSGDDDSSGDGEAGSSEGSPGSLLGAALLVAVVILSTSSLALLKSMTPRTAIRARMTRPMMPAIRQPLPSPLLPVLAGGVP